MTNYTYYQCSDPKCKARDLDRGANGLPAPQVLNCWSCGAGLGMDPGKMMAAHVGMFPCPPPPETVN